MSVRSLNISATGMYAMQELVDSLANDIANSNTTAYKNGSIAFRDLAYQSQVRAGILSNENGDRIPTGLEFGAGVEVGAVSKNHVQGPLTHTPSSPLNVAINGNGFFLVTLPNGDTAYTRDGTLQKNAEGEIVNLQGQVISPGIIVPENALSISISSDGHVQASMPSEIEPVDLGQFDIAIFNNPAGLRPQGNNLYLETAASGTPILGKALDNGFGELMQFYLEDSNVNTITSLTDLIKAQRAYEMNSRVINTTDHMIKNATDAKA